MCVFICTQLASKCQRENINNGEMECLCAWNGVCIHEILDSIVREILFENATFERSEGASYIYYMEISGRRLFQIETK